MQHHEFQYTVESLLQAHSIAIEQVRVLCRSAGRYWIHQQSCEALASTYKQALQKLTSILTEPLLSQQLNPQHLQLLVQPALDTVLAAIHQGKRFLETCRPSVSLQHQPSSASSYPRQYSRSSASFASSDAGEDASLSSEHTITDDTSTWLHRALLKGHATDAMDTHLHDFLTAFSAVGAAVEEDLNARIAKGKKPSADRAPLPDLFWKEQNKPHVLLVSAQRLDHVKHNDDTFLNSQLEHAMNRRGNYPDDVDTRQQQNTIITMAADIDAAQLAAFVKEKIRCAKQDFKESICLSFLDINQLERGGITIDYFPTSNIHKVMWLGREFVLKVYKESMEEQFLQEAKIHLRLYHPNVVHAVALFKGEKVYGLLIELMDEDLKSFLKKHAFKLTLQEKVSIMLQIAKGMAYVHERGVIHRDLKPSNVLVRSFMDTQTKEILQLEVKVADFGDSKSRMPDSSSFITKGRGTSVYRSPEVLNEDEGSSNFTPSYNRSADVYSFAMTCFELLVEKEPFHIELYSEKRKALWKRVVEGERPDLASISDDTACPPYLKHCLQTWWADDPKTRHSFTHICCILRHLYVCLARCRKDTEPILQLPFLAWPFWRWKIAQDIAQERMEQFEIRRANEDWKDKGYLCESTRVNEIPYELHVMKWAIKKAAEYETEDGGLHDNSSNPLSTSRRGESSRLSSSSSEIVSRNAQVPTIALPGQNGNRSTQVPAPALPANVNKSRNFRQKLKDFCCFSAPIVPSNHEIWHPERQRRNL